MLESVASATIRALTGRLAPFRYKSDSLKSKRNDPFDLIVGWLSHQRRTLQIGILQSTIDAPGDESQALLRGLHFDLQEALEERSLIGIERR